MTLLLGIRTNVAIARNVGCREFGRVGHMKKNMKCWQRGSGSGRRSSQSFGSARTRKRRGRGPRSAGHRSFTSVFALVIVILVVVMVLFIAYVVYSQKAVAQVQMTSNPGQINV